MDKKHDISLCPPSDNEELDDGDILLKHTSLIQEFEDMIPAIQREGLGDLNIGCLFIILCANRFITKLKNEGCTNQHIESVVPDFIATRIRAYIKTVLRNNSD